MLHTNTTNATSHPMHGQEPQQQQELCDGTVFPAGLDSPGIKPSVNHQLTTPSDTFPTWEADPILVPSTLAATDFKVTAQPSKNKAHF